MGIRNRNYIISNGISADNEPTCIGPGGKDCPCCSNFFIKPQREYNPNKKHKRDMNRESRREREYE